MGAWNWQAAWLDTVGRHRGRGRHRIAVGAHRHPSHDRRRTAADVSGARSIVAVDGTGHGCLGCRGKRRFRWWPATVLGISFGSGLIIDSAREGRITRKDGLLLTAFLAPCHAVFEDTLLFVPLGVNPFVLLGYALCDRLSADADDGVRVAGECGGGPGRIRGRGAPNESSEDDGLSEHEHELTRALETAVSGPRRR